MAETLLGATRHGQERDTSFMSIYSVYCTFIASVISAVSETPGESVLVRVHLFSLSNLPLNPRAYN